MTLSKKQKPSQLQAAAASCLKSQQAPVQFPADFLKRSGE